MGGAIFYCDGDNCMIRSHSLARSPHISTIQKDAPSLARSRRERESTASFVFPATTHSCTVHFGWNRIEIREWVHGRFSKKAKRRGHVPRCARPRSNSTTNPQKPGSNPTAQSTGTRSLSSPHVRPADAAPRQLPPHDHPEHCSQQYPAKSEKIRTQFLQLKERGEKCRVFRLRETTMRGGLLVPPWHAHYTPRNNSLFTAEMDGTSIWNSNLVR
jgi:hypothetical protein